MENENEQVQTTEVQEDAIMPVGWDGETDFFEWASAEKADEPVAATADSTESGTEESEEVPATDTETEEDGESVADTGEVPATEQEPEDQSEIKFNANINHKVQNVELDKSQLPELYEKAYAADKFRTKLNEKTRELEEAEVVAKILGYDNAKAMLKAAKESFEATEIERLTSEKVHPTIAKDTVTRRIKEIEADFAKNRKDQPKEDTDDTGETQQPGQRDFRPEVAELLREYPELQGKTLPKEVVDAALAGQSLTVAYTKYVQQQTKAEQARLKKENKTLKQNAEAAKRAPVRGVAKGGATNIGADDPFLTGFSSYGSYK